MENKHDSQLFENYKFWVSRRIPAWSQCCENIRKYGGKVVSLEKQAHMLIADGARRDCPPDAYSYKLIEDSVEHGCLQVADRYRIGAVNEDDNRPSVRPAGSAQPAKRSRTPFTSDDDARLVKFVLPYPHKQNGNQIYQEFERLCPRHTWQSWRSRWTRNLQYRPAAALRAMADSAPADSSPSRQEAAESQPATSPAAQRPSETPKAQRAVTRSRGAASPELSPGLAPQLPRPATRNTLEQGKGNQLDDAANDLVEDTNDAEEEEDNDEWDSETEYQHRFLEHLGKFAKDRGLESEIKPLQTIGDRVFSLFHLLQAVVTQDVQFEDVKWDEVAEHEALDLDGSDPAVTEQLRDVYDQDLREFVANYHQYVNIEDGGEDDEEDEADEDQIMDDAQPQQDAEQGQDEGPSHIPDTYEDFDGLPRANLASAPRQPPSTSKCSRHSSQALPSRKRRRLSSIEIPSTPDERLGVIRPSVEQELVEEEDEEEDAGQRGKTSPTVKRRLFNVEVKDSQEDSQDAFTQAKALRRSGQRSRDQALKTQATAVDITPSQQLQSEDLFAASPEVTDTVERLRTSPTPKEVVPRIQASAQTRTPQSSKSKSTEKTRQAASNQATSKPPAKPKRPVNPDSPRHVPAAVVPPRRSLPSSFAGKQTQAKPPSSNPLQGAPSRSPQTFASSKKAETKASASNLAPKPSSSRPQPDPEANVYDPDSQDPLNEPPGRPRLTSGLSTLSDWINHYQSFYPRPIVNIGLKATTMTPGGQAAQTMESLRQGKGIPTNYEGVWTARDDKGVEMVNAVEKELGETLYVAKESKFNAKGKGTLDRRGKARKEKARLMDKHGEERMRTRLRFLEAQRNEAMTSKVGRIERWRRSMDPSTGAGT